MKLENVIGVGSGHKEIKGHSTDEKSIIILVKEKLDEDELGRRHIIPEKIEEVTTDVIEVGEIELLTSKGNLNRTKRNRPAQPGISIGHYKISAGTFGAVVKDKETKKLLILSNNHVLANLTSGHDDRAEIGDPILQPGRHDGGEEENDIIGHLERFVPLKKKSSTSSCQIANGVENILNGISELIKFPYQIKFLRRMSEANLVDCAVAKPVSEDLIKSDILELGRIEGTVKPEIGVEVIKSGRTSGVTTAKIRVINATVEVNVTATEKATFKNQIITGALSKPGDSGSLVLNKDNKAVGLLFAGSNMSTICNPINHVMEELEIEFI